MPTMCMLSNLHTYIVAPEHLEGAAVWSFLAVTAAALNANKAHAETPSVLHLFGSSRTSSFWLTLAVAFT